jgi:hypothetical protein
MRDALFSAPNTACIALLSDATSAPAATNMRSFGMQHNSQELVALFEWHHTTSDGTLKIWQRKNHCTHFQIVVIDSNPEDSTEDAPAVQQVLRLSRIIIRYHLSVEHHRHTRRQIRTAGIAGVLLRAPVFLTVHATYQ